MQFSNRPVNTGTISLLKSRILKVLEQQSLKQISNTYTTLLQQERLQRMVVGQHYRIQRQYLDNKNKVNIHQRKHNHNIIWDIKNTYAYVAFRMIPRFGIIQECLSHVLERGWQLPANTTTTTVLDFGSGPGTASWATWSMLSDSLNKDHRDFETTFVEPSLPMLNTANSLVSSSFKTNWAKNLIDLTRGLKTKSKAARYDLVLATYTLSELDSVEVRDVTISLLWDLVKVGGCLLIIETGSKENASIISRARDLLLSSIINNSNHDTVTSTSTLNGMEENMELAWMRAKKVGSELLKDDDDGEDTIKKSADNNMAIIPCVIAPCGHNRICPFTTLANYRLGKMKSSDDKLEDDLDEEIEDELLLDNYNDIELTGLGKKLNQQQHQPAITTLSSQINARPWCHFVSRADRLLIPTVGKDGAKSGQDLIMSYSYLAVEKKLIEDNRKNDVGNLEHIKQQQQQQQQQLPQSSYTRILRSPIKNPGRIHLDLCHPSDGLKRLLVSKRQGEQFNRARKAKWGDVWEENNN
jgi:ribosomal protein RSM22 (predicted rRNA methylase)